MSGRPMRVLHWSEYFWPYIGGVEVGARQVLPLLEERNCEIVVVTGHHNLDLPDEDTYGRIRVRRFRFAAAFSSGDLEQLIRLRREIGELKRAFRPDLVHVNQIGPSVLLHHQTCGEGATPTVVTLHTQPRPDALRSGALYGSAVRSADWVTAWSAALLRAARAWEPEIVTRSSVIYPGLQLPRLAPARLSFDPPRLLCLGRLVPVKGFDRSVEAFARVVEPFPSARLAIAGDGAEREELRRRAAERGIGDRVEFLGWVKPEEVPALINRATLVLMPSRSEGLPLTAIQAGQMGRPIVATRVGGLPEVVVDGETGILVEPDDVGALADAIGRLLAAPATAQWMGEAARRRIRRLFTLERYAKEYFELYCRLAAGQPGAVEPAAGRTGGRDRALG